MADIVLRHVSRVFNGVPAVDDITMTFPEGSVTCLLGPSGCGKTTLMRMIAGLDTAGSGRILFGDRDVTALPARKRNVAMVFQYPVMYRTLSVEQNIALPIRRDRSLDDRTRRQRIEDVMDVMQLQDCRDARMHELDVGTRQRVAVARSIARSCEVVLFDEPTTNVEVNAKLQLIRAFKAFRARLRQTVIYVTHDQTEAMTLADRIALMQHGRVTQCDAPHTLYDRPSSEFGGWFLGNPGMNFLDPVGGEPDGTLSFGATATPFRAPPEGSDGVRLGIRPERVVIAAPGGAGVSGRVMRRTITIGGQYLLLVAAGGATLRARAAPDAPFRPGDDVSVHCPIQHMAFFRHSHRLPDQPELIERGHP